MGKQKTKPTSNGAHMDMGGWEGKDFGYLINRASKINDHAPGELNMRKFDRINIELKMVGVESVKGLDCS